MGLNAPGSESRIRLFLSITEKEPKFDGRTSGIDFITEFQMNAASAGLNNSEAFRVFRFRIANEVLRWFDRSYPSYLNPYHSYEELMELYDRFMRTYEGTSLQASAMAKLRNRKHKPGESYESYYSDILVYGRQAGISEIGHMMVHFMETGLSREDIARMGARHPDPTLTQVYQMFREWDALARKQDILHPVPGQSRGGTHHPGTTQAGAPQPTHRAGTGNLPTGSRPNTPTGTLPQVGTSPTRIALSPAYLEQMADQALARRLNQYQGRIYAQGRQGAAQPQRQGTVPGATPRQGTATSSQYQGQQGQSARRYPPAQANCVEEVPPPQEGADPEPAAEEVGQEQVYDFIWIGDPAEVTLEAGVHTTEVVSDKEQEGTEGQPDPMVMAAYVGTGYQAGKGKIGIVPGAPPPQKVLANTQTVTNPNRGFAVPIPIYPNQSQSQPNPRSPPPHSNPNPAQTATQKPPQGFEATVLRSISDLSQTIKDAFTPYINNAERQQLNSGCFKCGMKTHIGRECTFVPGNTKRCFNCDSPDHFYAQCPKPKRFRSDTPTPGQRDGSDQTTVSKNAKSPPQ
jgi:hypothetical protein